MNSPTVLIIEDDPTLVRGLADNFRSEGYQVQIANEGEAGIKAALATPHPHLIVLDIMLPKVNGFEICRAVRERALEMPIIMLTARNREQDIIRGLELGADDYVTKPFSIRELLARARAFLRRHRTPHAAVFQFGEYKLDLTSRKLFCGEKPIALTAKESRLLEFLVQRPGRALTRDQILDGVWGDDLFVGDRSVNRCVTTLRAKIETDPRHPVFIQTIRDIGYRFEAS